MRVLALSPFRDGTTGWAKAGVELTLALDAAGVDVVARALRFNAGNFPVPERLLELEARPNRGPYDAVLQVTLPQTYDCDRRAGRSVGYYFVETSDFRASEWARRVAAMDECWVPCRQNMFATAATGLPYPKVVPVPCDPARYGAALPVHPVRRAFPGDFLFYFIGEAIARKNIGGLAAAFHLAFDPDEPVQLVIKTAVRGLSPPDAEAQVRQSLDQVKRDLGLYPSPDHYKREVVITTPHDDAGLDALHASCDCFASATRGEGWNLPAFDAMAFGKTPVLTDCGAHPDFAGDACRLVDGHRAPVVGMSGVHDNLYHAGQDWVSPDIRDFAAALRHAYDDDAETRRSMAAAGRARVAAFSREAVGAHMRTLLEAAAGGGR